MADLIDFIAEKRSSNRGIVDSEAIEAENEQQIPWYQSIPADILKGIIEGTVSLGQAISPIPDQKSDIFDSEPQKKRDLTEFLNQYIPSGENVVGQALRRGANIAPFAVATPAGASNVLQGVLQSLAAGGAGQSAQEMGFGGIGQTIAEILPFLAGQRGGIAPQTAPISQKLAKSSVLPEKAREFFQKRAQKTDEINDLISFAQREGMTAEQIAPLIQGEAKKNILGRIASKGRRVQEKLSSTKQGISNISDKFTKGEFASASPSASQSNKMMKGLNDIFYDIPSQTRNVILEDFKQFANSPKDVKSIIRFYRAINESFGVNKKQLGRLKEPLKDALTSIDPGLGKDFDLTNKLFQKYYDISSRLKPSIVSDFLDYATVPKVAYGLMSGNYAILYEALGEATARKLAAKMLIDPKLTNISSKLANALNKRQFAIADRIKDEYIRSLNDEYPDVATELQKESFREFIE